MNQSSLRASSAGQVWNLEGMQAGSPPPLIRSLKPFAANHKMPEAAITCIALHEGSWPRFTIAVGLATCQIYILRGGGSGNASQIYPTETYGKQVVLRRSE